MFLEVPASSKHGGSRTGLGLPRHTGWRLAENVTYNSCIWCRGLKADCWGLGLTRNQLKIASKSLLESKAQDRDAWGPLTGPMPQWWRGLGVSYYVSKIQIKEKASNPHHYFVYSSVSVVHPRAGSLQVLNFFARGPAQIERGHIHFPTNDSSHSVV